MRGETGPGEALSSPEAACSSRKERKPGFAVPAANRTRRLRDSRPLPKANGQHPCSAGGVSSSEGPAASQGQLAQQRFALEPQNASSSNPGPAAPPVGQIRKGLADNPGKPGDL